MSHSETARRDTKALPSMPFWLAAEERPPSLQDLDVTSTRMAPFLEAMPYRLPCRKTLPASPSCVLLMLSNQMLLFV